MPDQNNNVTCWQELYLECQKAEAERNSNVSCPVGELSLVSLDEQVVSVSDLVSISSGLPDGNSFTAGPTIINIEALNYIGDTTDISVYLGDHFNNPVPDGTAVYLTTEGGSGVLMVHNLTLNLSVIQLMVNVLRSGVHRIQSHLLRG